MTPIAIGIIIAQAVIIFIQTMRVAFYKGYFDRGNKRITNC